MQSSTTYISLPLPANSTSLSIPLSIPLDSARTSLSLPLDPSLSLLEPTTTIVNGKQIKVFVKTVQKQTLACEACRARKRRCDGHAPCTYCVSKKQECIFAVAKKRGPSLKKKRVHEDEAGSPTETSLVSAQHESEILDIVEGNHLNDTYSKFVEFILPLSHGNIMKPRTTTHKVQSYVALAYIARMSGVKPLAQKYISQARLLSGSIYDRPEMDSVAAMMIFAMYWNLISDFTLSRFYCDMAFAITQMIPVKLVRGKLGIFVTNLKLCSDQTLRKDPELLSRAFKKVSDDLHDARVAEDVICKAFMNLTAETLSVLHFNILGDNDVLMKRFNALDDIIVSEEGRRRVQRSVTEINAVAKMFAAALFSEGSQVLLMFDVECPLYEMVVALKTGHIQDGLNSAWTLLRALQNLHRKNALAIITKVANLYMIGSACRLLHKIGYTSLAMQIFEFIKIVCKQMEPDYNYILANTEFATDGSPVTNLLFGLPEYVSSNLPNVNVPKPFPSQVLSTYSEFQFANPEISDYHFTNSENSDSSQNSSPSSIGSPSHLSSPLPPPPSSSPPSLPSPPSSSSSPQTPPTISTTPAFTVVSHFSLVASNPSQTLPSSSFSHPQPLPTHSTAPPHSSFDLSRPLPPSTFGHQQLPHSSYGLSQPPPSTFNHSQPLSGSSFALSQSPPPSTINHSKPLSSPSFDPSQPTQPLPQSTPPSTFNLSRPLSRSSFDLSQPPSTPLSQTYAINTSNGISFEAIENHDLEDILQQLNT